MSGYVWYSAGSDVTGPKLAAALGFAHGKKTPDFENIDVLVGWGCNAEARKNYSRDALRGAVRAGKLRVLNHPDAISAARNKLELMKTLAEKVTVPGLVSVQEDTNVAATQKLFEAVDEGRLILPCIGMTAFHKGKPVFCWTKRDLEKAVRATKQGSGAHYFRSLLYGEEYRIHVFRDSAICAEVKSLSADPLKATASSLLEKVRKSLPELKATEEEVEALVGELGGDLVRGPSHMLKSVNHGWQLKEVALGNVPAHILSAAIEAVDASGLDMGAVSITDEEGTGVVTNIVAAPGLDDERMALYVEAIQEFRGREEDKEEVEEQESAPNKKSSRTSGDIASPEIIAKLTRKIRLKKISTKKAEAMMALLE